MFSLSIILGTHGEYSLKTVKTYPTARITRDDNQGGYTYTYGAVQEEQRPRQRVKSSPEKVQGHSVLKDSSNREDLRQGKNRERSDAHHVAVFCSCDQAYTQQREIRHKELARSMKRAVYIVASIAILAGIFLFTLVPRRLGLYRLCGALVPEFNGFAPAFSHGIEWNFTIEELSKADLSGQHALITGANSGIGYEIAKGLVQLGAASATLACRNATKCNQAVQSIRHQVSNSEKTELRTITMDTSSLSSVQKAAQEYVETMREKGRSLDMLFLNAGTTFFDVWASCVPLSEDGIEYVFATNHVGHHLLYRILEPLLLKSPIASVVSTSSSGSYKTYSYKVATDLEALNGCTERFMMGPINYSYGQSKLAQILWTKELSRRLGSASSVYVNTFHPGAVDTGIFRKALTTARLPWFMFDLFDWLQANVMWTASEGAHTGLFLGAQKDYLRRNGVRGLYFHPQGVLMNNPLAEDEKLQEDLWTFSESLVRDFLPDSPIP